ncbi:DNA cytosine methyltransferase [Pluralibacter gergoviae]|uniref:DNA cytosine methyltransferase n=1 Tax=Pluralibacter gergoviae TaxID=61647 RepID=UPI002FDAE824
MVAYYNEIDPFAAQWLRNLIAAGHIAPGVVDTRSIEDITPNDLKGFSQVHLFAGIGGWSLAMRRAGWPDTRPAWTASCPCQPFSQAGKGLGFADERHLWPSAHWLVGQRRPVVVFGEQSGSANANDWIDLVQADVEALGYAFGACAFPSSSVGAPHQRDRAYWVADADRQQWEGSGQLCTGRGIESSDGSAAVRLDHAGRQRQQEGGARDHRGNVWQQLIATSKDGGLADAMRTRPRSQPDKSNEKICITGEEADYVGPLRGNGAAGPVNGFWRDADWLLCRDGKWRPVSPGSFPLADGVPGRVGRLRAYGNAINIEAAAQFIRAYMARVGYV